MSEQTDSETDPLLAVRDLEKHYPVRSGLLRRVTGQVKAVDGVSFDLRRGETLGLVGESGCGKSTTASTVLGLEEPTGGEVRFDGEPLSAYGDDQRSFRRRAQIIFQDPNSAFDPRLTVGESVREPLEIHGFDDTTQTEPIVADILERVGLSAADADRYPHQFSDGQKQRLALARALVLDPDLLVADEPVSALDVSVQADVLSLLDDLRSELDLSMLFISHDLGVVRQVCDRVGVMYLGEIVELAPTEELFEHPQHPYTRALLDAIPDPDPRNRNRGADGELEGDVPDASNPPAGCSFHTRCPRVIPPDDYDLPTEVFRDVLDLRLDVERDDLDPDLTARGEPAAIRAAYDLPSPLPDEDAESVLSAALESLAAGEQEAAVERLGDAFTSVCERAEPTRQTTEPGRSVACHLYHDPQDDA
ncbi:MAG: ABC transporter ATP-binding protein [Haloglomus sp.]